MKFPRPSLWQRLVASVTAVALVAGPASATWSIVVVNTRTREACVASATCLANFNLRLALPVLRPGLGCGASQSAIDDSGANRLAMYNGFAAGLSPQQILAQLVTLPAYTTRQFGIVDFDHTPVTYSGVDCADWAGGVIGEIGDLRYAIQGNILVGPEPVMNAEQALLNAPGDLSQKVMAAMEAARAWGGDGRCSCSASAPTSCGAPPPQPFKSAHVGFILLARVGDTGGAQCGPSTGCAPGNFYLARNVIAPASAADPVLVLQQQYALWRAALAGRPDHLLTNVLTSAQTLVADGVTQLAVEVELRDVENAPITHGGHALTLNNISGAGAVTTPSAVVDHGDGTYSFTLQAGLVSGQDVWRVVVNDGVGPVTLYPELHVRVDPLAAMHVGRDSVSAARGDSVPIVVNWRSAPFRPVLMLASTAGTAPGLPFAGAHLPLNMSSLLMYTYSNANSPTLQGTYVRLDASGRAEALFAPDASLYAALVGSHVDWSAVVFHPSGSRALAPVGFDVLP